MKNTKPFTFIGFTSLGDKKILTDKELVIRDLNNHFETIFGECDWDPTFGARFKEFIFNQQTSNMQSTLQSEIARIINFDPRLKINKIDIQESKNTYLITCAVTYLNNDEFSLSLSLDKDS